jgi:hypothetical protein
MFGTKLANQLEIYLATLQGPDTKFVAIAEIRLALVEKSKCLTHINSW